MLNILYIGPNDSEWAQMNRPVSLAAAKWARGFLTALAKCCHLTVLTHTYERAWPKGNVFWRGYDARLYPTEWECEAVSYPVLKYIREIWWRFAYAAKARRIVREKKIDAVLIYNCYESWQVPVLKAIKKVAPQVKIYPIILDGDDPRKDDWGWLKRAAQYSDGFVCLSWWVHQNITAHTGKPSYHMDGGADGWCGVEKRQSRVEKVERRRSRVERVEGVEKVEKVEGVEGVESLQRSSAAYTLVHTGALDQWRGLDFMIEVVRELTAKRKDVKFVFTGKSQASKLKEVFGNNPQVELPGFVSEERMNEICNVADVLLSVRDPKHPDNILNYPSKLPHYLSFGRPIVSTRLDSLSPDYAEVVHFSADDTPASYVAAIEDVLTWPPARRAQEYDTIRDWFSTHKTWSILVSNLVTDFLASPSKPSNPPILQLSQPSQRGSAASQPSLQLNNQIIKQSNNLKVLCFHPALAPYRVDFFNQLAERTDFHLCLFNTNLLNQKFDQEKIQARVHFGISYLLNGLVVRQRYFRTGIGKMICSYNPDVVLSFEYSPTTCYLIVLRYLARKSFRIFITTDDNTEMFERCHGVRRMLRSFVLKHIDGVVTVADDLANSVRLAARPNRPVVCTVPIIYDEKEFRSNENEVFALAARWRGENLKHGERSLLYVGRLVEAKNVQWLLDRVADPRWPSRVRLYIVGGGDEEDRLRRMASEHRINDKVVFCGRKEGVELSVLFAAADAFILPSIFEPFGAVVSEALHWGVPAVVSSHVGAKALIRECKNGFVFDLDDHDVFFAIFYRVVDQMKEWNMGRKSLIYVPLSKYMDNLAKEMS